MRHLHMFMALVLYACAWLQWEDVGVCSQLQSSEWGSVHWCLLHSLKGLGGQGQCCSCQQPLLRLTRVSWLTYLLTELGWPHALHTLSQGNETLFSMQPFHNRWLSQLVYDMGYTICKVKAQLLSGVQFH